MVLAVSSNRSSNRTVNYVWMCKAMEERRGGGEREREREREMVGRKTQEERGVQRTIYARVPGPTLMVHLRLECCDCSRVWWPVRSKIHDAYKTRSTRREWGHFGMDWSWDWGKWQSILRVSFERKPCKVFGIVLRRQVCTIIKYDFVLGDHVIGNTAVVITLMSEKNSSTWCVFGVNGACSRLASSSEGAVGLNSSTVIPSYSFFFFYVGYLYKDHGTYFMMSLLHYVFCSK